MIGKKIVCRYFRGDNYMEIDFHVGSSVIASQIVGVCRGYGKHFASDVAVVIQGENCMELPEKILACASLHKIDIDVRQKLE
jgi:Protein ENHANCED DISEASE RESISTANCE 2, C-terminal